MKSLIALLVAVGFCVMLFAPPLAAKDHDPAKPLPWMDPGARPNGDEGGWGDPVEKSKSKSFEPLLFSRLNFAYPFANFLIIRVIDNSDSQDKNDSESLTELRNNRRSNPE